MIQTKPKPRISDGIVMCANHRTTVAGTGVTYGIAIRTGNCPVLILHHDIVIANQTGNVISEYLVSNITTPQFNSITTSAIVTVPEIIAPSYTNVTQNVSMKAGIITGITIPAARLAHSYNLATDNLGNWSARDRAMPSVGRFRNGGRLLRPNTSIILYVMNVNATVARPVNQYIEWIEGDYDYEDIMGGGRR